MNGPGSLQRSSWKAEAIRRGELKISNPIPLIDDAPPLVDREKEPSDKDGFDPLSSLPDTLPQETQNHPSSQHSSPTQSTIVFTGSEQVEARPQQLESSPGLREERSSTVLGDATETHKRRSHQSASYSSPSLFPPNPESSTKTTPKKKRRSGLRNVFRKMFGKKGKEEFQEKRDSVHKHAYHRSDPGVLSAASPEKPPENVHRPRISDLPVRELEPVNPLGQHLPFPMNVNAPQESSPPHEYLTFNVPAPVLDRRRATLPSVLLSKSEVQALSAEELPSWEEQHDGTSLPSPQIGIALSSPPHATQSIQSKRRSRSAGALRDLLNERPSVDRRRSAEIRYWRQSYRSGSVHSVTTPRPRTAQTAETARSVDNHDAASGTPKSIDEASLARDDIVLRHDQDINGIPLSVTAFNFGNLKSSFSEDEPPATAKKRRSIDERVRSLEENVCELETSVRRISARSNRQTVILEDAPMGRRSRNPSPTRTGHRQGSQLSSTSSSVVVDEMREVPSPTFAPTSAVQGSPRPIVRPQTVIALETSTVQPSVPLQSECLAEQLAIVSESLKHERVARKALEEQVLSLRREVAELHSIVSKFIPHSPSYPTPSPDAIIVGGEERIATPRASARNQHGLEVDIQVTPRRERNTSSNRFSQSDIEIDEYSLNSSREDVTSPESWATPKEESNFGSGFFRRSKSDVSTKGPTDDEMF